MATFGINHLLFQIAKFNEINFFKQLNIVLLSKIYYFELLDNQRNFVSGSINQESLKLQLFSAKRNIGQLQLLYTMFFILMDLNRITL